MQTDYTMPDYLEPPTDRFEVATNMAHFLQAQGLTIFDSWAGRMSAADQRRIFGFKMGKGTIHIDGEKDTAQHRYKTCFGQDSEASVWLDCCAGYIRRNFYSHERTTPHEREIDAAREWFQR